MKLPNLLSRPKWQDKDPGIRRIAVATDNDPDLVAALREILRADDDPGVRLAALKRVNEYELWRERSTADSDMGLRRMARENYLALFCADSGGPPLPRRVAELETLSVDEIDQVALRATLRELRADALERVQKSGVLAEAVANDPDSGLRLRALERIEDAALLARIAERMRRTDKAVSRHARERAEAIRIAAGDVEAITRRARHLCDQVEVLMREPDAAAQEKLRAIGMEWLRLGGTVPAELVSRYNGARQILAQPPRIKESPAQEPSPMVELPRATETEASTDPVEPRVALDAPAAAAAQRDREVRHARLRELEDLVARYAGAIEAGDSAAAHAVRPAIDRLTTTIRTVPASLEGRIAPLHARYADMERWLHWSTHKRRAAICDELVTLPKAGLHPDALATRVRELREEWQRLDATEHGNTGATALTRRFQALCHRALRPAKSYFDKRDEVRRTHTETVHALLARTDAMGPDSSDWKVLAGLRIELGMALRQLDGVEPRERTALAKRIKHHISGIAPRLEARARDVESGKEQLISRARALAESAAQRDLPRGVRELQREWTALGNGRRGPDQRQWREFRAACDAVFGKLDADRKQRDTSLASARAQVVEVVGLIEALADEDAGAPEATRQRLRDIDARWNELVHNDRVLEQRYRRAHDAVTRRLKDAARMKRLRRYESALGKYRLLRTIETGVEETTAAAPRWESLGTLEPEFGALDARFARTQDPAAESLPFDTDAALDVLVRLEFLAGVESPPADRQRRMDHQVRRLSARLRGGESTEPAVELVTLLAAWFDLPAGAPTELDARFEVAARAAIDALP
jgi:DNA repair protein SbcC/Rad50